MARGFLALLFPLSLSFLEYRLEGSSHLVSRKEEHKVKGTEQKGERNWDPHGFMILQLLLCIAYLWTTFQVRLRLPIWFNDSS